MKSYSFVRYQLSVGAIDLSDHLFHIYISSRLNTAKIAVPKGFSQSILYIRDYTDNNDDNSWYCYMIITRAELMACKFIITPVTLAILDSRIFINSRGRVAHRVIISSFTGRCYIPRSSRAF